MHPAGSARGLAGVSSSCIWWGILRASLCNAAVLCAARGVAIMLSSARHESSSTSAAHRSVLLTRTCHRTWGGSWGLLRTLTMHTSLRQWCAAAGALKVMVACAVA